MNTETASALELAASIVKFINIENYTLFYAERPYVSEPTRIEVVHGSRRGYAVFTDIKQIYYYSEAAREHAAEVAEKYGFSLLDRTK